VRSAGLGWRRKVALGLLRSHDAHGHAEPLDAVGEVEAQPAGDPRWQRRDDDLVVLSRSSVWRKASYGSVAPTIPCTCEPAAASSSGIASSSVMAAA
jgi:hypothetical protein